MESGSESTAGKSYGRNRFIGRRGSGGNSSISIMPRALFASLCLLLLVAVVATSAIAAESEPPGPPTALEMQEGLNADNSAVYEAELTDLQAAEELPHQDLDRTQALDLLVGVFDPLLQAPAGVFDELDVERFLSANAAIIAPGNQPQSNGVSIGAPPQNRYEGTTLLESTIPLRDESDAGKTEVVDLGLEPAGDGTIAPSNPLVEVALPQQLGDGIELPEAGITVKLAGAPGALRPSALDQGVAAYPEVAEDTTLAVAPAPGGFETFTLLQSPDAPTSQTFTLDLPAGASLQATRDGGAEVVRAGEPIMGVSPPTALDAAGEDVPASMTVAGDALTLDVSPQASTEFPVLLDPLYETYNWWNGITGLGGWAGYTNFTPNYYTADKATCTTYASPYACQAGVTANAPGLYIGGLPGAAPVNSSAAWQFRVPRWQEEWANNNRPPTSFISHMTLENVGFWHRTDSTPDPTLWAGIWNTAKPGWVSGWAYGGNSPNINGNGTYNFPANGSTEGKEASFALSNPSGHDLTAFRDAFLSAAIVTIGDTEAPKLENVIAPSNWVDQVPSEPITAVAYDTGLGVHRLKVAPDGVMPGIQWPTQSNNCTGTTIYPCSGEKQFSLTAHGQGASEVRDYDPSVMPQGINYVTLTAEDPLGNKASAKAEVSVDHTAPRIAPLSGTLTEQATLGTNASKYTLKYSATDGDHAAPAALTPFGSSGATDGKFNRPQGVAIDSSGNIWVVDKNNNRVQKFDESGKFLLQFGGLGSTDGKFNDPRGIAVSSNGTVWVVDVGNKRVQAFNSKGEFLRKIVNGAAGAPELVSPYDVASGAEGTVWVSDTATHRVYQFSESGAYIRTAYGSANSPSGESSIAYPVGIATDAKGNLWVVDKGSHRLQKFAANGKYVTQFGMTGTGAGQLKDPVYVTVAQSGNLLITEELTNRVQVFQPNGVYLRQFGSTGTGNGQFSEARGIAINADNTAFVADASNHRVTKWSHADLDRQSGVVSTEVKVDGNLVEPKYAPGCATEDCAIMNKEWMLQAKDYASGQHTVQVTATDGVGLPTPKPLTITTVKDTTGPELTANNAFFTAPEGWLEQKSYVYIASASDSGGYGVSSLTLKIDGKVVKTTNQSCPNGGCGALIAASINMANYKGGAHPGELIATDLGGNTTTKKWTINVNPDGEISSAEAAETLDAADTTSDSEVVMLTAEALDPEQIAGGDNPGLQQTGAEIESTGTPNTTTMTTDPADGFTITSPEGETTFTPVIGSEASDVDIAGGVAGVASDTANEVDTVIRPQFNGAQAFSALRSWDSPQAFAWTITLGKHQSLVSVDSDQAQVVYDSGTVAYLITAEQAHDATGKEVPTSLEVNGSTLTLHVEHQSATFVYPVVAGQSFETGYETPSLFIPPPPGEPVTPPPSGTLVPLWLAKAVVGAFVPTVYVPAPDSCSGGACISKVRIFDLKGGTCSTFYGDCDIWRVHFHSGNIYRNGAGVTWYNEPIGCERTLDWKWDLTVDVNLGEPGRRDPLTAIKGSGDKLIAYCKFDTLMYPVPEFGYFEENLTLVTKVYPNGFQETLVNKRDPKVNPL